MWEVRALAGRIDDLLAYVLRHADPTAEGYRSVDDRVVVLDRTGRGVPELPGGLAARPPHAWSFDRVERLR